MHKFFEDFLERLQVLHDGIKNELNGLPGEALDWIPYEEMNSLAVLVVHTAASERYWIGDVVMGEPSNRIRDTEFHTSSLDANTLIQRLDHSYQYVRSAVERLDISDLDRQCISPSDGKMVGASKALLHTMEHTGIHLGHIQLTRQLWEKFNN